MGVRGKVKQKIVIWHRKFWRILEWKQNYKTYNKEVYFKRKDHINLNTKFWTYSFVDKNVYLCIIIGLVYMIKFSLDYLHVLILFPPNAGLHNGGVIQDLFNLFLWRLNHVLMHQGREQLILELILSNDKLG